MGRVGPANYSITAPPYDVKSCDQIILVQGKMIKNFTDYCEKSDAFFTMSVYMVNVFSSEEPDKLIESITLDRLVSVPGHLQGAPNCINFQAATKRLAVCFDSAETVNQLLKAYKDYLRCRMGDNLQGFSIDVMWKLMRDSCNKTAEIQIGANSTNHSVQASGSVALPGGSALSGNSTKSGQVSLDINPYYSDLRVPGTR